MDLRIAYDFAVALKDVQFVRSTQRELLERYNTVAINTWEFVYVSTICFTHIDTPPHRHLLLLCSLHESLIDQWCNKCLTKVKDSIGLLQFKI